MNSRFLALIVVLSLVPAAWCMQADPSRPRATSAQVAPGKSRNVTANPIQGAIAPGSPGQDEQAEGLPPSQAPVSNATVLKIEPEVLDLGEMVVDTTLTGKVKLTNVSDKPITVMKAITSCGCTTAGVPKEPIAPGASVEVDISLKAGPKPGQNLSKRVTFQIEGYAPAMMTVQGQVPAYVSITPDVLQAPADDQTSEGSITLKSVDGTPFRITAVVPPITPNAGSEASTEHVVNVDWDAWRSTGRSIKVTFSLDHPKAPSLSCLIRRPNVPGSPNPPAGPSPAEKTASALVMAARKGDKAEVGKLLDDGARIDAPDSAGGRTAMHWAAKEGQLEVVTLLIERGADLTVKDRAGKTPLCIAAESGKADVVQRILDASGDRKSELVNMQDRLGGTSLMWASALGTPECVELLLSSGAEVNVKDKNGLTPLLWAAGIGDPRTVTMLLDRGADMAVADNLTGDTAIMRAARNGKLESLGVLIERQADVKAANRQGMTAWLIAAANGKLEKLKALQQAGSDVNARDTRGWNAVDHARNRSDAARGEVVAYLEEELKLQPAGQAGGVQ
jgi:ankyrin repeat protein